MKKYFTKEIKIAVAAIAALVVLFFGMNFLKGLSLFSNNTTYKLAFNEVKGLTKSTAVYADGYRVGSVMNIIYDYEKHGPIIVEVGLDPSLRIPAGSQAEIKSDLMGNTQVNILLANNPRQRMEEGDTIKGVDDVDVIAQVKALVPVIQQMVPKMDSIVTSVNLILSNPAIINMLQNVDAMSANLKETTAQLNVLMSQVNKEVPGMLGNANQTLVNTKTLTDNLAQVDINGTMQKVNRTLDNVEQMTRALNSQEGTLGLLMHDKALYNNLNSTVSDADSLMIDLKAHPKRYVHFSVFGKKDK
ncbi:MAG: MCE family protein [Prevotella sp.]|nr:MCE family protein [Candidatus Prevotella equi]